MKFSMDCWVMILTERKSEELGGEPVSVPLCPPQIAHELACLGLNQGRSVTEPWQGCASVALSTPPHLKWVCELRASGSESEQVADRRRAGLLFLGQFAWCDGLVKCR